MMFSDHICQLLMQILSIILVKISNVNLQPKKKKKKEFFGVCFPLHRTHQSAVCVRILPPLSGCYLASFSRLLQSLSPVVISEGTDVFQSRLDP